MPERKGEELLLQRNGFQDQLLPCDRPITDTRTGSKPMPETEQARVQGQNIAAESFRLGRFGYVQHTQNVALEMCPTELPLARVILQISGTAIAAQDSRERSPQ